MQTIRVRPTAMAPASRRRYAARIARYATVSLYVRSSKKRTIVRACQSRRVGGVLSINVL